MKCNVYVVKDLRAGAAMRPLFMMNDGIAMRSFKLAVMNVEDPMGQNPEDFSLYWIGFWDDELMKLEGAAPVPILTGAEALKARSAEVEKIKALHEEIAAIEGEGNAE